MSSLGSSVTPVSGPLANSRSLAPTYSAASDSISSSASASLISRPTSVFTSVSAGSSSADPLSTVGSSVPSFSSSIFPVSSPSRTAKAISFSSTSSITRQNHPVTVSSYSQSVQVETIRTSSFSTASSSMSPRSGLPRAAVASANKTEVTSASPLSTGSSSSAAVLSTASSSPVPTTSAPTPSPTAKTPNEPAEGGSSSGTTASSVTPASVTSAVPSSVSTTAPETSTKGSSLSDPASDPSIPQQTVKAAESGSATSGTSPSQSPPESAGSIFPPPTSGSPSIPLNSASSSSPSPDSKAPSTPTPGSNTSPPASLSSVPAGQDGRVQGTAITSTDTVTDTPESTFSTPVSISETVSGKVTLTAPPLITSIAASTQSDGTVLTVTNVISNPNGFNSVHGHSFFDNHGAVIAVFLVSGIIAACIAVTAFCFCRRRYGGEQLARSPPSPRDPFVDPSDLPPMSDAHRRGIDWGSHYAEHITYQGFQDVTATTAVPSPAAAQPPTMSSSLIRPHSTSPHARTPDDHLDHLPQTRSPFADNNLDNLKQSNGPNYRYEGPFSDYYQDHRALVSRPVGIAYSTPSEVEPTHFRAESRAESAAPSSPSVYPPSLPDEKADSFYERELYSLPPPTRTVEEESPFDTIVLDHSRDSTVPKTELTKPKRLTLDGPARNYEFTPLTPPGSSSSRSRSHGDSPVSDNSTALSSVIDEKAHRSPPWPKTQPPPEVFLRRTYSKRGFKRAPSETRS